MAASPVRAAAGGFSAFYLNRCNRSGILLGGAPIGGYAQTGKWRIDARFNRANLAERVLTVARKREQIHITNMDALTFLAKHLPHGFRGLCPVIDSLHGAGLLPPPRLRNEFK